MSKITLHGEEINVGDSVYSLRRGWGVVVRLDGGVLLIGVEFKGYNGERVFYQNGNFFADDKFTELHWDEVKIVPPKKPLLPVYEYLVVYLRGIDCFCVSDFYYTSLDDFKKNNGGKAISLIEESRRERK